MTDLIERLPPIICSQGGIPYNKAHLDAKDARIAELSAALKAKAAALKGERLADAIEISALHEQVNAAESLLASVRKTAMEEAAQTANAANSDFHDEQKSMDYVFGHADACDKIERAIRALASSSPPREGEGSIKPETTASAFPSSLTTGDQRVEDALLAALLNVRKIISEAALTGFNCNDGDWVDRLFFSQQKTSAAIARATNKAPGSPVANSPSNERSLSHPSSPDPKQQDQSRWLNDLLRAAEAFRGAMVESGALIRTPQNKYLAQLRALECALNPLNYTFPPDPKQQAGGPEGWQWVPKEPTKEMMNAVWAVAMAEHYPVFSPEALCKMHRAMLAASPPPPGSAAGSGENHVANSVQEQAAPRSSMEGA
jgi:hypothetical protein